MQYGKDTSKPKSTMKHRRIYLLTIVTVLSLFTDYIYIMYLNQSSSMGLQLVLTYT